MSILFALDFVSPTMLGWLAVAAAPMLIHLWSRRRYHEMAWAAMEYLLAAVRANRRRVRLEQWLLLAVRISLVVLVVLAMAEPLARSTGLILTPGERTHRLIVIDSSFSMGYRGDNQTLFEAAKELARQIVEESGQGDGFTLVLMGDPPRDVIAQPSFDRGSVLAEIAELRMPHATADLAATLSRVERILAETRTRHPKLIRHEVFFLTDLGRTCWREEARGTRGRLRDRFRRLADSATLVVFDLGVEDADNVAVTDLRLPDAFITSTRSVRVEAALHNFGRKPVVGQSVELLIDGRRVKQARVNLAPGGHSTVVFSCQFESPGEHDLAIRADGDRLDVDNVRRLAVPVKPAISVLCVDGRPSGHPFGSATDYLVRALAPGAGTPGGDFVHPHVVPESMLVELDLRRYDCVFLVDVAQFTTAEVRLLEDYLKGGGGLVFFLGDRVLASQYNNRLASGQDDQNWLLPARLGPVVAENRAGLDPLEYQHPIVRDFRGHQQAGLLTTPVGRYFRLIVPEESSTKTALALDGGDPLIVERRVYRGRVVLVATSADASWTAMPVLPSYVPLVQELLNYAAGNRLDGRNRLVGQCIGASLPSAACTAMLTVQAPWGGREAVSLRPDEDATAWSFCRTDISGIYTAEIDGQATAPARFAVNVDPVESDLAKLSAEALQHDLLASVPLTYSTRWQGHGGRTMAAVARPSGLAKKCLYALLVLLLLETYLARRFGHFN